MAKSKGAKKKSDFDFKQFLMQKGEYIVFGGATVFTLLLVALGLMSISGSESPAGVAGNLDSLSSGISRLLSTHTPAEELKEIDPEIKSGIQSKIIARDSYVVPYEFFEPSRPEETKRQKVPVLPPVEFIVHDQPAPVRTIWVSEAANPDDVLVKVLEGAGAGGAGPGGLPGAPGGAPGGQFNAASGIPGQPGQGGGRMANASMGLQRRFSSFGGGGGVMGGADADGTMPQGGGMVGARGGMAGGGRRTIGSAIRSGGAGISPSGLTGRGKFIPWKDLTANHKLVETITPLRMVVVHGSYPYAEQLEEMRKALRYPTIADMYADGVTVEFRGFNVERRVTADSRGTLPAAEQTWEPLDLNKELMSIYLKAYDFELDDPNLQDVVIIPGLTMFRPQLARGHQYPPVENQLILETMKEYKDLNRDLQLEFEKKQNTYRNWRGHDPIFNTTPIDPPPTMTLPNPATRPGMMSTPQSPTAFAGRSGAGSVAGAPTRGAGRPGFGGGGGGRGGDPFQPNSSVGRGPMGGFQQQALNDWNQKHVLFRMLDVEVKPGYTYEYRVQVKMYNPSYQQKDLVAYPSLAEKQEIVGDWSKPFGIRIAPEFQYYAVDQNQLDREKFRENFATRQLTDANLPNPPLERDKTFVQVHRFVFSERTNKQQTNTRPIGDWAVAKRMEAFRGEYIGRPAYAEMPVWDDEAEMFTLIDGTPRSRNPNARRRDGGIEIDFNTGAVVVDFEGGKGSYPVTVGHRTVRQIQDDAPVDVLVIAPDGKLELRNSRDDSLDPVRGQRFQHWDDWVKTIKLIEYQVRMAAMKAAQPAGGGRTGGADPDGGKAGGN